ncbi:MAG TPA: magnesium-protoporphyrin IX monomethyl ester anaerobic oxidative cyclase [Planctomycetota bacterium]|nr:magnesium-protoporphyrin IX monomethyl ester anaerobic oxidative cyclase [Planctomycetota bacterium]
MRVLLINVPHPAIGSRIPDDHLPPLGLLSVGGPLIDDGHEVRLLDADLDAGRETLLSWWRPGRFGPTSTTKIAAEAAAWRPDVVLFGHSGSTSGHPVVAEISREVRALLPRATIVYGGVFPSYHWREILEAEPQVDVIVRGEGEETARQLLRILRDGGDLRTVAGLAFRDGREAVATPPARVIQDLDRYRIGWELIDFRRYSYWGGMRAVVVQFSRGCPHPCTYCGQRGFWTRWRHRDPVTFAAELARLHREHGVELVNFADENPTVDREAWRRFLEALIAENVPLTLVGSTRADDIVRDADLLPLYRKAGWVRFLLGMENTDEDTLKLIRKGGSTTKDREAVRLLRKNGILSMATWVAGFEEDDDRSFWRGLRQLLTYDPDQIQALYVTPHRWTPYFRVAAGRRVIQKDARRWDYKHQVLATRHLPPWRVILWVKFIEAVVQLRPKALWRTFLQPDARLRHAMRWYAEMGRRVWFTELKNFFLRERRRADGPTLEEFWGRPQDAEERSMVVRPAPERAAMRRTTAPLRTRVDVQV